jgi:hypothetical protein
MNPCLPYEKILYRRSSQNMASSQPYALGMPQRGQSARRAGERRCHEYSGSIAVGVKAGTTKDPNLGVSGGGRLRTSVGFNSAGSNLLPLTHLVIAPKNKVILHCD